MKKVIIIATIAAVCVATATIIGVTAIRKENR